MEKWQPGKELINAHERRLAKLASHGWNIKIDVSDIVKSSVAITDQAIKKMITGAR